MMLHKLIVHSFMECCHITHFYASSIFTVRAIRLRWLRAFLEQCRTKVPSTSLFRTFLLAFNTHVRTSAPRVSHSSGKSSGRRRIMWNCTQFLRRKTNRYRNAEQENVRGFYLDFHFHLAIVTNVLHNFR